MSAKYVSDFPLPEKTEQNKKTFKKGSKNGPSSAMAFKYRTRKKAFTL